MIHGQRDFPGWSWMKTGIKSRKPRRTTLRQQQLKVDTIVVGASANNPKKQKDISVDGEELLELIFLRQNKNINHVCQEVKLSGERDYKGFG